MEGSRSRSTEVRAKVDMAGDGKDTPHTVNDFAKVYEIGGDLNELLISLVLSMQGTG